MKNLSFRGKRKDNGEWVESGSIIQDQITDGLTIEHNIYIANAGEELVTDHDIETDNMLSIEQGTFYAVDPETVGQWTGLTDKNGKRIFEGDICKDSLGSCFVVEWENEGRFLGFTISGRHIAYINREPRVEVIGNIHDNPELQKGE